MIRFLNVCL